MRVPASVLALAVSVSAPAHATAAETPVVLDENGYFRIYYQFGLMRISPQALKAEGEKLLSKERLDRLRKETQQHLKDRAINWADLDWRDFACTHFRRTQLGDDARAVELIQTLPPPSEWPQPDFDDASWLRQRVGRLPTERYMAEAYEFTTHMIRTKCLRTYFLVPAPDTVKDLRLSLRFRGGARVFINGAEVARSHLPQGELDADTPAEDYSREAYLALPDEVPEARHAGTYGDIRCPWDQAPLASRKELVNFRMTSSRQALNQKGWERLARLRDRELASVPIPAKLLRKGANVLAIEIRGACYHPQILPGAGGPRAENWDRHGGTENHTWDHCRLLAVELRSGSPGIPSCLTRPPGVQVWVEDPHTRLFSRDFTAPASPMGTVRIVGAPNGTFSALIALGTDRELAGLKATASDLNGADGAPIRGASEPPTLRRIEASAIQVAYLRGHPLNELYKLGFERCLGMYDWRCPMAVVAMNRYGVALTDPPKDGQAREAAWRKLLAEFQFFDHISPEPPPTVPANTCQPIWLSLKVPADARPGAYRGTVRVEADGMEPVSVPVEVEVIGWRVPGPREFQSFVESEQSPYGVAKAHKVELWSEAHWKLIEASLRQLARLGADCVFVPVLLRSEFGNREDSSMIRWVRKQDGALRFDYSVLDRYLDLVVEHWGEPKVLCVQIMHGCPSETHAVRIHDEATGKDEVADVGPSAEATRRPLWRAFATALLAHLRERGLDKSLYWGHAFDMVVDPGLVRLMAEFTPGVHWAAGAHGRKPDETFRVVARAYGSDITDRSLKGWKNPFVHLVMPRTNGSVICVEGTSTPFTYRVLADRAIYCGFNGLGRMGADYYETAWMEGFRGGQYLLVGRSCVQTLWPGPNGAESSARNEAMLEGIQEAEAHIFLEQALDRSLLPPELAAEVQKVLDDHFRATLHIPGGTAALSMMDYRGDWQARSRRLFATAAKAADVVGLDVDRTEIGAEKLQTVLDGEVRSLHAGQGVPLPAAGQARESVVLRNWTPSPRAWKAAATEAWIKPEAAEGRVAGQQALGIALDGTGLQAGKTVSGTLTVTDVLTGRGYPIAITAQVVKPFELIVSRPVFNVTVGESEARDFLLVNRTALQVPGTSSHEVPGTSEWAAGSSVAWLKAEPSGGKLAPGASLFVKVTAQPPDQDAAVHDAALTLTAMAGAVKEEIAFKTFVIPPYRRPDKLPAGEPVPLETVSKPLLVRHRSIGWFREDQVHKEPTFGPTLNVWHGHQPLIIGDKKYGRGLWIKPHHETVYKLEGTGFTAFSAEVGWNRMVTKSDYGAGHTTVKMSFEVHVDGRIRAQSGLMSATDPARLLVVEGLAGARELRLVSRTHFNTDEPLGLAYCNWAEPTLYKGR